MCAGANPAEVSERDRKANCAVATHVKVANVIEEDDACDGVLGYGLAQQSPYDDIIATRFKHARTPDPVVVIPQRGEAIGH